MRGLGKSDLAAIIIDGARLIFEKYRAMPGSDQIATEFAIRGLIRWAQKVWPQRTLEIGPGLGTLTETLLNAAPMSRIVGVEREQSLRAAWVRRWPADACYAFMAEAELKETESFDLIIVDDAVERFPARLLARGGTVFFEGNRGPERLAVARALLEADREWTLCVWRPPDRSKGYWILRADPTIGTELHFCLVTIREALLDLFLGLMLGRRPGWRRRSVDARY